ncbi:MAG: hypothetical protein AAF399_07330 [Bacteroidota bacterium]
MDTKALLISNSSSSKKGKRGQWHLFEEAQPYIQGIDTNIDKEDIDAQTLNSLVSGIPSPWARARLFGFAFPYTQVEANIKKSGLIEFYEGLINEWKGLLACIALFPDRIRVSDPIPLDTKDEDPLFHIPNALGRMLFEDADLWCDPDALAAEPKTKPFIQLIYYAGELIGATSPYSLLFTGVNYSDLSQVSDMTWYRDGAFTDPLPFLNNDQKQKLYLLVRNIIDEHFMAFEKRINSNRKDKQKLDFTGMKEFLRSWKKEIRVSGTNIVDEGTLDASLNFAQPFYDLFNVKQILYFYENGRVSFKGGDKALAVDPKDILLQEDHIIEFKEIDEKQPLAQSAVYYLPVPNPDHVPNQENGQPEQLFFPIPLSEKGYLLFKNRIGDLLSGADEKFHYLAGNIKLSDYKLIVELHLVIDDKKLTPITKEYELQPIENERSVIMWPNFIAEDWESYYLYSEFPVADKGTQLVPFFRNANSLNPILSEKGRLIYADSEEVDPNQLRLQRLVNYPQLSLDSSFHKYDIVRANKPVAGLELRKHIDGIERVVGYLILKNPLDESMGDQMIRDFSSRPKPQAALVGIDFGSNNSCVQYAKEDGTDVKPVPFTNRRVFLVGAEVIDSDQSRIALPHELFFFQNVASQNGQVKSWLHEHDPRYVVPGMQQEEIAGGVAIFKPNIHIRDMNLKTITTNAGTLHHSMKWLNEQGDIAKKMAYLRTIWIKTCADLYANGFYPSRLRWSYPGSFTQSEVSQFLKIYQQIVKSTPLTSVSVAVDRQSEASTEAEAVSYYALGTGITLGGRNAFVGIDVGGSTSDILVIALDRNTKTNRLMKQSSLRLAAGYMTEAIRASSAFQQAILGYYNDPGNRIRIPNIQALTDNPDTAPFFLNSIFDRLKGEEFQHFYDYLSLHNRTIFALPVYMTGLLMYYAGQLVAKTMSEHDFMARVKRINLFPFGKGGRIFDWAAAHSSKEMADEYYNLCFQTGFGKGGEEIQVEIEDSIRQDNKSEVAKGLVNTAQVSQVQLAGDIRENSDIFGEQGFLYYPPEGESIELDRSDSISPDHFRELQFDMEFPEQYAEFKRLLAV